MKVKKIVLSTLTVLMIASQLTGCAGTTQEEAMDMVNRQDTVEIEIVEPDTPDTPDTKEKVTEEKNTETSEDIKTQLTTSTKPTITYEWKPLGYMENYGKFRKIFDEVLGNELITEGEERGKKTGVCYVDLDGNYANNSTLRYAMTQPKFLESYWNNEAALEIVGNAVKEVYADVETDSEARLAAINAYYNIFNTPEGEFAGNSTISRAEFLTGLYKAHNPVNQLETTPDLPSDEFNPYVNQMNKYSYINLKENNQAYDGTITRAEAIYTIVKVYYGGAEEVVGADFPTLFTDAVCKEEQSTNNKLAELNEALQNPDEGMTLELYSTLMIAAARGLIEGSESRWEEGITRAEALDLITGVLTEEKKDFIRPVNFIITELEEEKQPQDTTSTTANTDSTESTATTENTEDTWSEPTESSEATESTWSESTESSEATESTWSEPTEDTWSEPTEDTWTDTGNNGGGGSSDTSNQTDDEPDNWYTEEAAPGPGPGEYVRPALPDPGDGGELRDEIIEVTIP